MSAHSLVAILPCNDLDVSQTFYARLGLRCVGDHGDYRILNDGKSGELHLTKAVDDWLVPGRNPFGLYLRADDVEDVFAVFTGGAPLSHGRVLHPPQEKPWGMFEFALSDPDETLVRVGRPSQ